MKLGCYAICQYRNCNIIQPIKAMYKLANVYLYLDIIFYTKGFEILLFLIFVIEIVGICNCVSFVYEH